MLWNNMGRSSHGVLAKVLDCDIIVNEIELQTNTMGKDMSPLFNPAVSLIALLLLFDLKGLGIEYSMKADLPLSKETKPWNNR